jgi:hypothetical protein
MGSSPAKSGWVSDAVFDALDEDQDGKISSAEISNGLGGVLHLATAVNR